ncbi:ribonucleases P/MRP protein subunit POP1 isoform X2 [Quillaja saponaria]|uniref:Ribonucleases P/MRP protein subunit POP1 isoform X2 n=1 Tax=Quillaja saponaria TaxID=32244 RepID=A0AAD7L2T7_QUISA|nr:ribonucleases P/MRP protein subunit POP1 isoform X2 [Quillaja saponaria]
MNKDLLPFSSSKLGEINCSFDNNDLWDISKGVRSPIKESILCTQKQEQLMEYFCFDNANSGKTNTSMKIPEDPVTRESHRFCIGFFTTGFVEEARS